jgi:hypothetical protein
MPKDFFSFNLISIKIKSNFTCFFCRISSSLTANCICRCLSRSKACRFLFSKCSSRKAFNASRASFN